MRNTLRFVLGIFLSGLAASQASDSALELPFWEEDKCKNIYPSKCPGSESIEEMARRCPGPRQFVPRKNPENICCPKYGCICNGIEDANGVFRGSTEEILKRARFEFGNCTIIRGSVVLEIPAGKDPFGLDDILSEIEEIWGHLSIQGDALTELRFKNLRIIRGLHTKKGHDLGDLPASLTVQSMTELTVLSFPKLKEISRGSVIFHSCKNLCLPLTIDYYGELFANPCDKNEESFKNNTISKDAYSCQGLFLRDNCVRKFPDQDRNWSGIEKYRKNRKFLFEDEKNNFKTIAGRQCAFCEAGYQEGLEDLSVPTDDLKLRRCWDKTNCQILSKTVCKGPSYDACRSANSLFTKKQTRCNVGILKAEKNNFQWAENSRFDKCCPDSCSGGCDSFSSQVPDTSSTSIQPVQQYWTECSACKNDNDKHSYKNTFFLNRCVPSCKHPFRVPLLIKDQQSSDYEVQFCRESSKCRNRLIYDPEDSNCVRFCGKRFGSFTSIEYDSLVSAGESDSGGEAECKRCEAPEHLYIPGDENGITYGYNCTSGQFPEAPVVCWGIGHDKFNDLFKNDKMTNSKIYSEMSTEFFATYSRAYSNCNIIDGDIRIHAGNGPQSSASEQARAQYEAQVCAAFRNVKYVTGLVLIEYWTMRTLGCFEHLKLIGGKTDTRFALTFKEFDPLGLVVKNREVGLNKMRFLGINVTVNAGISLDYGIPDEGNFFCHAKKEILDNFVLDDENGDKPVTKVYVAMVERHKLKDKNSLNATEKQELADFLEKKCENEDQCHPECGNTGCFGPSESDCRLCANFIDRTVEEAYSGGLQASTKEIQGAHATETNAIYRYDAFFEERENRNSSARIDDIRFKNKNRPKCVASCPVALRYTNKSTKECLPCHAECSPDEGCSGPTDQDCRSCRNFNVTYDHNSSSQEEIPFDIPESRGFCTPSCADLQVSTSLPVELKNLFEIKTIVRNPYFEDPNVAKKCKLSSCLRKAVSPYYDEETEEYNCDCSYEIDEENEEVKFKGISCKDILVEQKLKIENDDRANATVATYLEENCSSDFGVVISTANGKILFERCFDRGLNLGQISGIVIGVSVFFLSIAAVFIYKTRSRAILKRQKAKDVMQHLHPESNKLIEQTGEGADPRKFVEVPRFRQDQIVFSEKLGEGNFGLVFKASLKIQETREIRAREASSTSTNRGGSSSDVPLMPRKEEVIIEIPVAAKQIKSRKKAIRDILRECGTKDLFTEENQRERILEKIKQFGGDQRMTIEQLDEKGTVDPLFIFDLQVLETRLNEKELFDEAASFHFLRHPHLVKVFGICEYYANPKNALDPKAKLEPPSPPSMVLEFALKGALDSYVNRMIFKNYKKLDEVVTIQWFYQISDAMAFLHQNNVLHRDLAARNILLTFDLKALVGDFGLAALASQSDKNAELSMDGSMMIPRLWYPYESLFSDGEKVYSTKSDVYSFGMLMWEVLTGCPKGRTKFFGDEIFNGNVYNEQVHRNLLQDRITPKTPHCNLTASTGYDTCTNAFYNDFMKPCWAFDPKDRPDFQILKNKFDQIRGRAKQFICLNKEQGKKVSRSSTSTLRLDKQHSATLSSQVSQESPSHVLSQVQIQATRDFDPLENNYRLVPNTNRPAYQNQESPAFRSVQPPTMPGLRQRSQGPSAFHFPRHQRLSDNAKSTTSATNNHYQRGPSSSFDSPTRNTPNRLYSNATQMTNLTNSIPEPSSHYQNATDQLLYQNVNDDVFAATGAAPETRALLENEEDNFYQNSPLDKDSNYVAPR